MIPLKPEENRPYVAVATREGVLVNQHLGEATALWVYGKENGENVLIAKRNVPLPGAGDKRWEELSEILKDCRLLLAAGAGANPSKILDKNGIEVILMEGMISEGLSAAFGDGNFSRLKIMWEGCGSGCSGQGRGCG
jgi:nitrogen fixation protein NifB